MSGNGSGISEDIAFTLNKVDNHAVVYDNHAQDSRVVEMGDVCNTVSKKYGTGGGNVPLVQDITAFQRSELRLNGKLSNLDISPTLKAQCKKGDTELNVMSSKMQVRRLTPVECCRLQGFPDDWNEWGIDENGKRVEMSDSNRYKQLGNAVTVNVTQWLASVIKMMIPEAKTMGELFAGIGGFGLGFQREGFESKWAVEWDKHCQMIIRRNFPETKLYSDVTQIKDDELEPVDVMTYGFPCQDVSVAGKRKGVKKDETRSGLFYQATRLIRSVKPRIAIFENVPGLISSDHGRDFAEVLRELARSGYGEMLYLTLDSQFFGVAQRRRRVFGISARSSEGDFAKQCAAKILSLCKGVCRDTAESQEEGKGVARNATDGIRTSQPLCSRDYKGPGTDGLSSSSMIPVVKTSIFVERERESSGSIVQSRASRICDRKSGCESESHSNRLIFKMDRSDKYHLANMSSTIASRDYKSATDLIVED